MDKIYATEQYAAGSVSQRIEFGDSTVPVIETALQHAELKKLSARTGSGLGVTFVELPVTGLLVLRARDEYAALNNALKSTLNLELPKTLGSNTVDAASSMVSPCVRWVAPDEWMLSCPVQDAFSIELALRAALGDKSVAIVNVTGGYTVLRLSGAQANAVLKKSTAYDVHATNFGAGKVVNTVMAKAQVTLRCVEADDYELIVRRSFADYLWHWIQVASAEFGLSITSPSA